MKVDIYGHERRYKNWKEHVEKNGIEDLTKKNSDILKQFVFDMEVGSNTSNTSPKGRRSYHRLNCVRQKLYQIFRMLEDRGVKNITKVTEKQITSYFDDMREGIIKTARGTKYKATADYVKGFKAFWNWRIKVNRKEGKTIPNIAEDLDASREEKPRWVYLDEKQISKLLKKASANYAPFLDFLYCSGSRVTEGLSIRGRDIEEKNGIVYLTISNEIAKSSGRKIKLLLCGKNLLRYIKENKIKEEDILFPLSAPYINRYLNRLGKELFGDGLSKGGEAYSKLTMYDFRHNSCCYWLTRYKTNSALMYKFGWKKEQYIHYYSEFLGMKDPIRDEDLYVDITKTEIEKELIAVKERLSQHDGFFKLLEENPEWKKDYTKVQKMKIVPIAEIE